MRKKNHTKKITKEGKRERKDCIIIWFVGKHEI